MRQGSKWAFWVCAFVAFVLMLGTVEALAQSTVSDVPKSDLSISKRAANLPWQVNGSGSFTIIVTNNGPGTVPQGAIITVTDSFPAGLTLTSISGTGWFCNPTSGSGPLIISCTVTVGVGGLSAQTSLPLLTLNVTVQQAGVFKNCASVSGQLAGAILQDPTPSNNESCAQGEAGGQQGKCDLVIGKSLAHGIVPPLQSGQQAIFEIVVTNQGNGPCAPPIQVTEAFSAGLTYQSGGPPPWTGCPTVPIAGQGTATCTYPSALQPNQSVNLFVTFTVTAPPPNGVGNCAEVKHPDDTNPTNNRACIEVPVVKPTEKCDLAIQKSVSPNPVQSGQQVTIILTVTNVGTAPCPPGAFPGTVVHDMHVAGLTFMAPPVPNQPGWQCSLSLPAPSDADCGNQSTLPVPYSVTFTINAMVTAPAGSSIQNCAMVTNSNDTILANNKDCVTINVTGVPCKDVTMNLSTGVANWTVNPGPVGVTSPLSAWVTPGGPVSWIQPANSSTPQLLAGGIFYQYSVPFTIPGPLSQYSSITITGGKYAADNSVEFFLNGPSTGVLCTGTTCFQGWHALSITSGFTTSNTLVAKVYNNPTGQGGTTYTGLVVDATLQAICKKTPSGPIDLRSFDTNGNGTIDDSEFFDAIDQWVAGQISDELFFQLIDAWVANAPVGESSSQLSKPVMFTVQASKNFATFVAEGHIATIDVKVFDLNGQRVFSQGAEGAKLKWSLTTESGKPLANGVYLYIVRGQGFHGEEYVSEVRKLVLLR